MSVQEIASYLRRLQLALETATPIQCEFILRRMDSIRAHLELKR